MASFESFKSRRIQPLILDIDTFRTRVPQAKTVNFICIANDIYLPLATPISNIPLIKDDSTDLTSILRVFSKTLKDDCLDLLRTMNTKYPYVICNICIFSQNDAILDQIRSLGNKNIIALKTQYPFNIWELIDEHAHKSAIEELGALYTIIMNNENKTSEQETCRESLKEI